MSQFIGLRHNPKIPPRILLLCNPEVVLPKNRLILVANEECRPARIAVEGDVVADYRGVKRRLVNDNYFSPSSDNYNSPLREG